MRLQHFVRSVSHRAPCRAIFEGSSVQQKWPANCRRTILLSSQNRLVSNAVARTFQCLLNRVFPQLGGAIAHAHCRDDAAACARCRSTSATRIDTHRDGGVTDGGVTHRIAIDMQSPDQSLSTCIRISWLTPPMRGTRLAARHACRRPCRASQAHRVRTMRIARE